MNERRRSIGSFARLSRLTVHTLRHYDEIGLLRPASVDPVTGYRSYDDDQLPWALQLGVLRAVGMPLAELLRVNAGELSLTDALAAHRRRLLDEIGDRERAVRLVDALVDAGPRSPARVEVGTVPTRTVWAARADSSWPELESTTRHALARLMVAARRAGRAVSAQGALFPLEPAERVTVSAFVEVAAGSQEVPDLCTPLEVPGGPALVTEHVGDHGLLAYAHQALVAELARRGGAAPTTLVREEYAIAADGRPTTRVSVLLPA